MDIMIRQALPSDAAALVAGVKSLTNEIMAKTGAPHFDINVLQLEGDCRELLASGLYAAYLAEGKGVRCAGFATLCESRALYAGGRFGVIQEFYVAPEFRSAGLGRRLIEALAAHGELQGWKRLEMCTPPLPEFDRTLRFYQRSGFEVTGGRKMKRIL